MATPGKLGAVYAPVTDEEDELLLQENVEEVFDTHTELTSEFQLANEYVLRDSETVEIYNTGAATYEETNAYEINYITGLVKLDEATDEDVKVTYDALDSDVEGNFLEQVAGFFDWSLDENPNLEESPEFGDDVVTHTATLGSWSGSADKYWSVEDRFRDWLGKEIVLALYMNTSDGKRQRYEGWAKIGDKSTTCPVDTLVDETINFEGQTKLEYREA